MLIRLLRRALAPYRRLVALAVALQGAQTLLGVYLPKLTAAIIDHGVARGDDRYIVRVGAVMVVATLGQAALAIGAIGISARVATRVGHDLRAAVFRRVMDMPVDQVATWGAGPLTNRTIGDPAAVQDVVTAGLTGTVLAPLMCAGAVVMAVRQDAVLSGLLLVVMPAFAVVIGGALRRIRPLAGRLRSCVDAINRLLREQVTGARVTRAFVRADHERDRFAATNADVLVTSVAVGRLTALMGPGILLVVNLSTIAVLGVGGLRVTGHHMSVGTLTAFVAYLTQIFMAASIATGMAASIPRADACAERILALLGDAGDAGDAADGPPAPRAGVAGRPRDALAAGAFPGGEKATGRLSAVGLSVRRPGAGAPVFAGVDLAAGPGETVAVVGGTGAGKSTLLHVVSGLLAPTTGAVRVGRFDLAALAAADRPALVGLVPQRAFLFAGTVGSNLRLGAPGATDDEMWAALEAAQAGAFVSRMPGGLAAPIAPGGANVSGGQRQRLAIARTLLSRPLVYLFDDPFAALDASTGAALRVSLRAWTATAAVVVTAQSTATAGDVDRVVTLGVDRIVTSDTDQAVPSDVDRVAEGVDAR